MPDIKYMLVHFSGEPEGQRREHTAALLRVEPVRPASDARQGAFQRDGPRADQVLRRDQREESVRRHGVAFSGDESFPADRRVVVGRGRESVCGERRTSEANRRRTGFGSRHEAGPEDGDAAAATDRGQHLDGFGYAQEGDRGRG